MVTAMVYGLQDIPSTFIENIWAFVFLFLNNVGYIFCNVLNVL